MAAIDDDIWELSLSPRVRRRLAHGGILRISELAGLSDDALQQFGRLDAAALREVRRRLEALQGRPRNGQEPAGTADPDTTPLAVLGLSTRLHNLLARHGCLSVAEAAALLADYRATGVKTVRRLGAGGLAELDACLAAYEARAQAEAGGPAEERPEAPLALRLPLPPARRRAPYRPLGTAASLPSGFIRRWRRQARHGGAIQLPAVASAHGWSLERARVTLLAVGFCRLTEEWYTLEPPAGGALPGRTWVWYHTALKLLRACGPLALDEIERGLARAALRSRYPVAPRPVLGRLLELYGFRLAGERVSWPGANPARLSHAEEVAVEFIARSGPVVSAADLRGALRAARQTTGLLAHLLAHSPLFVELGGGLYALPGAAVGEADLRRAAQHVAATEPNAELAVEPGGGVCYRTFLNQVAAVDGRLTSRQLADLTGTWRVRVAGHDCGSATVVARRRSQTISGLRPAMRRLGARLGERAELRFDRAGRTVDVAIVGE